MSEVLDNLIWLRALTVKDQDPALLMRMRADGHTPECWPSHVLERAGRVVGSATIGEVSLVPIWLDSTMVKPRESLLALNQIENAVRSGGASVAALPCWEKSPLYPYLSKLGYKEVRVPLFLKRLR